MMVGKYYTHTLKLDMNNIMICYALVVSWYSFTCLYNKHTEATF